MSSDLPSLSALAQSITPGRWQHFKGGRYEVLGVARHSEDPSQEFVVYRSLANGRLWVRPVAMWLEHVERDGYSGSRFTRIGDA